MNTYDINASRAELASCWINIQKSGNILRHHKRRLMDNILEIIAMQQFRDGKGLSSIHGSINERGKLKSCIDAVVNDGDTVQKHISGRDYDGSSYHWRFTKRVKSIFALQCEIASDYHWADGPVHIWFEAVSE